MQLNCSYEVTLSPLLGLKPVFAYPDGIFSPWQRWQKKQKDDRPVSLLFSAGSDVEQELLFIRDYFQSLQLGPHLELAEGKLAGQKPASLLSSFSRQFADDLSLLSREEYPLPGRAAFHLEGQSSDLFIHPTAEISQLASIDTREGAVVIESGVKISAFSLIKGPVYIGADSQLDRVSLAASRVGRNCRLGGEISDSLIGNFSNKHHEGFLGHSLVGDWVNLGALTTTSDLKNNYGKVRLEYRGQPHDTGTIKFGSIIGDFVKTAIGTLLNTGTIIEPGALLFEGRPSAKYYPPFFWGGQQPLRYDWLKFSADLEKIMARRQQKPDAFMLRYLQRLHNRG